MECSLVSYMMINYYLLFIKKDRLNYLLELIIMEFRCLFLYGTGGLH
nr:MAG TPA: hypothetical protein [Bacteriophage sp.]